ncbi:hypothetical protein [Candidatus Enterococcus mansonii]|uniref:Uncharacterized protein n=1 Tax=Candidatus Enterococcus mansonii TaxID=1834181 RepID=A0A242CFR7_9ENTE|nr:hypothetical protein [Enterococcus sp. 4G2_DIV0659]OTO08958.1 hypothetical protein A5880_001958 [Enterococcus sp. 4G2_DIV0659]
MDTNIKEELSKIKYHQKLLLMITLKENKEDTLFFQGIIDFDLSEKQVKEIMTVVQDGTVEKLKKYLLKENINFDIRALLKSMISQSILLENSKKLLHDLT